MKRCLTSLTIKKNENQNYCEIHHTPIRVAIIKMSENSRYERGCGETEIFVHCLWVYKMVKPLCNSVWWTLRKLNTGFLHDLTDPLQITC